MQKSKPSRIINSRRKLVLSTCTLIVKDETVLTHDLLTPVTFFFKLKNQILTKVQFRLYFFSFFFKQGNLIQVKILTVSI